jgi:hypothetical protein
VASNVIIKAAGRYEGPQLKAYQEQLEQHLGTRRARSTTAWLPSGWLHYAAARLLAQPWFIRHVVMDRWFLHTKQQSLVI